MRNVTKIVLCFSLVIPLAVACGTPKEAEVPTAPGKASTTQSEPVHSASAAAATGTTGTTPAAATAWRSGMAKDEQIAFMKAHVMPPMTKVFQDHDSTKFAKFGCVTCHGPQFKEPKEFLPPLALKDGKLTAFAEKPEMAKWMAEAVTPAMAKAMGLPAYDPTTHQGFGCGGCHAIKN